MESKVNTSMMKAAVNTQYGSPDVLQLKEIERPVPKDNEVLIKIHAVAVNSADLNLLRADPVLAKRYPLAETANAIRDMEAGRAQGKIVITM